jgi:acyl-CoA synthetase (AMP-forming)/AMP-acid ligase II
MRASLVAHDAVAARGVERWPATSAVRQAVGEAGGPQIIGVARHVHPLDPAVRGEEVLAVVVTRDGATVDPDELARFAAERLARYKLPKQIMLREELPKMPTGKISKGPLRDEFGSWQTAHSDR